MKHIVGGLRKIVMTKLLSLEVMRLVIIQKNLRVVNKLVYNNNFLLKKLNGCIASLFNHGTGTNYIIVYTLKGK